jgi:hypothetical protein
MSTFRFNLYYRSGALAVDRCALEVESLEQATEIFLRLTSEGFGVVVYDEHNRRYWWSPSEGKLELVPRENQDPDAR